MASRRVIEQEERGVHARLAVESSIRPEIMAELEALGSFTPHVAISPRARSHVNFAVVDAADQGNEKCPYGLGGKCGFANTCTGDPCLRMEGTDNN